MSLLVPALLCWASYPKHHDRAPPTVCQPSDEIELRIDGPDSSRWTIVLAHGAGANMDSDFMAYFAAELQKQAFQVVRFEFPYMQASRRIGKRRPPDREPTLRATWHRVIDQLGPDSLIIGGKSMGGRIASLVADEARVAGLVCLGYPFHPIGKPDRLRVDHFHKLSTPTLIVQGERDSFGNIDEVAALRLPEQIQICWLLDGDHSFKPRKSSGGSEAKNRADAIAAIVEFANHLR